MAFICCCEHHSTGWGHAAQMPESSPLALVEDRPVSLRHVLRRVGGATWANSVSIRYHRPMLTNVIQATNTYSKAPFGE